MIAELYCVIVAVFSWLLARIVLWAASYDSDKEDVAEFIIYFRYSLPLTMGIFILILLFGRIAHD